MKKRNTLLLLPFFFVSGMFVSFQAVSQCGIPGSTIGDAIAMNTEDIGCGYSILWEFNSTECTGNEYGQASDDIYYSFYVAEPSMVVIYSCAENQFNSYTYLFDGSSNFITSALFQADPYCADFEPAAMKLSLQPGTYYVASEGEGTHEGYIGTSVTIIPNTIPTGGSFYKTINAGTLPIGGAAYTNTQTITPTSCFVDVNWDGSRDVIYEFTLNAAANVKITGCGAVGHSKVTLSDLSSLIDVMFFTDASCSSAAYVIEKQLQPGTYYVLYEPGGNGSLTAKIKAEPTYVPEGATMANAFDAGTFGNCNQMYLENTKSNVTSNFFGNDFGQPSDDIFFRFQLSEPSTEVSISTCGSGFNTYLHLLNASGTVITSNDDDGPLCSGQAASIRTTLPAGTYYVVAEGSGNAAGNIVVWITVPRTFFPQGAQMTNPITMGNLSCQGSYTDTKTISNATCFGNDYGQDGVEIFYSFTIDYSAQVTISNCGSSANIATNIYLLNSSGGLIASKSNGYGNILCLETTKLVTTLLAGTYYVVSEVSGIGTTGTLTTSISFPFAPPQGSNITNPITLAPSPWSGGCDYQEFSELRHTGNCFGNDYGQPSQDIYYALSISSPSVVALYSCAEEGFNTYLHVLNSSGSPVASKQFIHAENPSCQGNVLDGLILTLQPGIYYLVSEGEGNHQGSVSLNGHILGNGIPLGATKFNPINLGTLVLDGPTLSNTQNNTESDCFMDEYGGTGGDIFYKFTLATSAEIRASICGVDNGVVYLMTADEINISGATIGGAVCGGPVNGELIWPLQAGTYFLVAEGVPSNVAMTTFIRAKLPAGATFSTPIEAGSFGACGRRAYSSQNDNSPASLYGNEYGQPSDDIFFRFSLTEPSTVHLSHCLDPSSPLLGNSYLHLLDNAGNLIESNDDNGPLCPGQRPSIVRALPVGVYYVVSEGAGNLSGSIMTQITTERTLFPPGSTLALSIDAGTINCSVSYSDIRNGADCYANERGQYRNDIFYKFRLSQQSEVVISLCDGEELFLLDNNGNQITTKSWPLCTANNALRIVLPAGSYYVVSGYSGTSGNIVTNISLGIPPAVTPLLADTDLNTLEVRSFDNEGLSGHSKSYYDINGQLLQSQTKQFSTQGNGQIVASQSLRDRFDRVIGSPMSAPVSETVFTYKNNYILNECGHNYTYKDFDDPGNIVSPSPVSHTVTGTLGWYYGAGNTWEDHVPVTDFPYSRIEFYGDGTSDVKRSASPGNTHRLGAGHEVLSGNFPVYSELNDYLAKREAIGLPDNRTDNTLKNEGTQSVSRDQNGKYIIGMADKSGKALISARQGSANDFVLQISNAVTSNLNPASPDYRPLTYFYILHDQSITIVPGAATAYLIEDIVKGEIYNPAADGDNEWEAGFYRIILTSGSIGFTYTNYYQDVSCQFYDDAGRLRYSVSPNGYKQWSLGTSFSNIDKTEYQYTHQGLMLSVKEPDAGRSRYVYRKDGKIRFSQSAKQKIENRFSYTHYDRSGRPVESGEYQGTELVFIPMDSSAFAGSSMNSQLEQTFSQVTWTGPRKDWVRTHYDDPAVSIPHLNTSYTQNFVAGAVSRTENENMTTWYSYDAEGRVTWTARKPALLNRTFLTSYQYDFSGNVLMVTHSSYQNTSLQDRFYHHYEYDKDKRLNKSFTSKDGADKKLRATYFYYLHGPLKRIELGDKVQGLDFVYNINGWLTQINHPDVSQDPGHDGAGNSTVRADAFGMVLDYYESTLTELFPLTVTPDQIHDPHGRHHLPVMENFSLKESIAYNSNASLQHAIMKSIKEMRRYEKRSIRSNDQSAGTIEN